MKTHDAPRIVDTMIQTSTPLYGRSMEVERIDEVLTSAREARGAVLAISGQAGIGKTALLAAARDRAADMRILACRGTESETRLPFATLHQLLRPILDQLDEVPPAQAVALRCALGLQRGRRPERLLV